MVWVYERTWEPARGDAHARESHGLHVILAPLTISGVAFLTCYLAWPPRCGSSLQRSPWPTTGISRDSHRSGGGWLEKGVALPARGEPTQ